MKKQSVTDGILNLISFCDHDYQDFADLVYHEGSKEVIEYYREWEERSKQRRKERNKAGIIVDDSTKDSGMTTRELLKVIVDEKIDLDKEIVFAVSNYDTLVVLSVYEGVKGELTFDLESI